MRSLILLSAISLGTGVLCAPSAGAQQPAIQQRALRGLDDVQVGAKLRIATIASPPERLEGRFEGVRGAAMTLRLGNSQRRDVDVAQLLRVDEAYRDRRRGAIVGVLPGLIGVYVWDFFGPHPRYVDQDKRYRENIVALAASVSVGGLIGAAIGWPRWRPIQTGR